MLGLRVTAGFGLAALSMVAAPQAVLAQPSDFRAQADAILAQSFPADGPGVAVIVTRGGNTVYASGRGMADIAANRPLASSSVFRLGSITKQFTAAVILQLVGEGRISLDDPLTRFFPDYPQPGATATVRQLLGHMSGIQSYTSIPGWMAPNMARPQTTAQMIAAFRDVPSPTRPGEAWAYNNSGYVLLGALIEQVTGKSWHEAIVERISRPLGLATIAYGEDSAALAATVRGYAAGENGVEIAQPIHMSVPHGAGGLVGSVEDLAKWARALHHGRVVTPALYQEMIRRTRLPDGTEHAYGMGLANAEVRGRAGIGHGGNINGFATDSLYLPEQDLFVAVFANQERAAVDPPTLLRRIAALALGDPYPAFTPVTIDLAAVEPLLGLYRIDGQQTRRFFARDGKLYTRRDGGGELEVTPAGDDRFFYGPGSLTWFRIERAADGNHVMHMHQNGESEAARSPRTGPIPPEAPTVAVPDAVLRSYAGRYATSGPIVTIAMPATGGLTIQLTGQHALPLRPLSDREFRIEEVDARIVFEATDGRVTGLIIHQGGGQLPARREGE